MSETLEARVAALEAKLQTQNEEYKAIVQDLYSWFDSRMAALKKDLATVGGYEGPIKNAIAEAHTKLEAAVAEFSKSLAKDHIIQGIRDALKGLVVPVRPATREELKSGKVVVTRQAAPSELR